MTGGYAEADSRPPVNSGAIKVRCERPEEKVEHMVEGAKIGVVCVGEDVKLP
ncbi:MAG: hypothetical protein WD595_06035 [Waddliaceae bacterium]